MKFAVIDFSKRDLFTERWKWEATFQLQCTDNDGDPEQQGTTADT